MAQMVNAQTVALQLEKVRSKLPLLYERDDISLMQIERRGDVERVSTRSMRIPVQLRPGGKAGQATMDGDDLGRGSGTKYDVALISPVFFKFAVEITKLVEYAGNSSEKAIENAAKREIKQGMAQFRRYLDSMLQTAGDGVLGVVKTVAGNDLTLDTPHQADLLYFNQDVQVMNAALTVDRGSSDITKIDGAVITLTAAPGGTVAGDKIVTEGVGTSPVSLKGIKYHQSNAATGLWLNLDRATFPEIRTPRVDAGSAALTTGPIRLALNKIRKALGAQILQGKNLVAYTNLEQEDAYESLGILIAEIIKESSDKQGLDLFFNGKKSMAGVPILASTHADPTRIDFLALKSWGRAVMQDIDFLDIGGQTVHAVYGVSGGLASAYVFYYITGFDVWNEQPRCGAYIDNLTRPAGY